MLTIIRYIFYREYRFLHKYFRKKADPFGAVIIVAIPVSFNISILIDLLTVITKYDYYNVSKFTLFFYGIILLLLLSRYLATKERIITIFKEFGKITKQQKRLLNWGVVIYIILTVILSHFMIDIVREMYRSGVLQIGGWGGYGRDMKEQEKDNPLDYIHKKY